VCSTLINFFIFGAYFLSKVYILESFPSKLRDQGMSIIYLTARIAEALSPSICELTFKWFDYGPIVYMGILCLIGAIASLLIPYETRDQAIDSKI
jgi:MFS-type transporter involved in bile tolerance (Atg22 family)